jgi:2-methylfumaryl-CoA isomerase
MERVRVGVESPPLDGLTVVEIGTSVLWSRYRGFTELAAEEAGNPLLGPVSQPGIGTLLAPGSPLVMNGVPAAQPAPVLGADTAAVLREIAERER